MLFTRSKEHIFEIYMCNDMQIVRYSLGFVPSIKRLPPVHCYLCGKSAASHEFHGKSTNLDRTRPPRRRLGPVYMDCRYKDGIYS